MSDLAAYCKSLCSIPFYEDHRVVSVYAEPDGPPDPSSFPNITRLRLNIAIPYSGSMDFQEVFAAVEAYARIRDEFRARQALRDSGVRIKYTPPAEIEDDANSAVKPVTAGANQH